MNSQTAKESLDTIIKKARVHLYKPIQIAEILYRDRVMQDIDLDDLESYRTKSRVWRDLICIKFLGRTSTSSAKYQDDIFNATAVPPNAIKALAKINKERIGIVEDYIYSEFKSRISQMSSGLDYCSNHDETNFQLAEFLSGFWDEPGLRRSIDKIYEIVVYSILSTVIDTIELKINAYIGDKALDILKDFQGFAKKVLGFDENQKQIIVDGKVNRVGVTNAADRGLDMWSNFGLTIQVKHLALSEEYLKISGKY